MYIPRIYINNNNVLSTFLFKNLLCGEKFNIMECISQLMLILSSIHILYSKSFEYTSRRDSKYNKIYERFCCLISEINRWAPSEVGSIINADSLGAGHVRKLHIL